MAAPNLDPAILAAISLLRVSGDGQDVARQRTDQEKTKRKFGLNITRTVELVGVSGTATLANEQVEQILQELKQPGIDGIQVSSLDRLFRPGKRYGQFAILDRFVDEGKVIWSAREGLIDPSTDEGYDKCLSAGGRAGAEWRELRRRTGDGKRETAEAGFLPHGTAKFGWDIMGRKQTGVVRQGQAVINEKEAAIAHEMFALRKAGMATYAIAARLNDPADPLHCRNKRGSNGKPPKPWSRTTVLQVLKSTDYIGKHFWKGIEIPIPRIVSDELFYEVQAAMNETGQQWKGRPSTQYRLRNFLYCTLCQHRCVGVRGGLTRGGKRRLAYQCGHKTNKPPIKRLCAASRIPAELIERTAWGAIWDLLKDPELLMEMGRHYYDAQSKPDRDIAQLEATIAQLRQRERNLQSMIKDAESDAECNALRTERKGVRDQIATLESELHATEPTDGIPALYAVRKALEAITRGPEPETYDEQRDILQRIVGLRMEYANGELIIEGQVPIAEDDTDPGDALPTVKKVTVQKCYRRVDGTSINVRAIPFKIKRRVL